VDDPARLAATALAQLGPRGAELTGVELTPANLESAYLAITGSPASQSTTTEEESRALVA
jgi:hypothetical protein